MKTSYSILLILFLFLVSSIGYSQTAMKFLLSGHDKFSHQDYRGAIDDYTKVIEMAPGMDTATAYCSRGAAEEALGDNTRAMADYAEAIAIEGGSSCCGYLNRAYLKFRLQDYRGAIEDFNKVIEKQPDFAFAYYKRGFAKLNLNLKESGCLDLSKAGELGYNDAYEAIKKYCQ